MKPFLIMRFLSPFSLTALVVAAQLVQLQAPLSQESISVASSINGPLFKTNEYTILTHEDHPSYKISLRVHDPADTVCDGATKGYSGYLDVGEWKHFYFYYFESRNDAENDPLIMWINGGPGCSSMTGLFMELGPCRVNEHGNGTSSNPSSWIEEANIFFLDQPIGVGFSYADKGHGIEANGTFAASEDVYAFMQIWYNTFPKSRALPFHIAGESYGGHYIPIFAKHIIDENARASSHQQVPLESVMIGNGIFDNLHQVTSSWEITCTNVTGIGPLLNSTVCAEMSKHIPRCEKLWEAAYAYEEPLIGMVADKFCDEKFNDPYFESGLNYYDVSKPCDGELCYPIENAIMRYLNTQSIRDALGIPASVQRFAACSNRVGQSYSHVQDGLYPTIGEVAFLLNSGLRILMYVGTYDWICNFVGNERWLEALEWKGHHGYRYASHYEQKRWIGGLTWEFENLRYARVEGAGHMVPYDKPEESLHMVRTWLRGVAL